MLLQAARKPLAALALQAHTETVGQALNIKVVFRPWAQVAQQLEVEEEVATGEERVAQV